MSDDVVNLPAAGRSGRISGSTQPTSLTFGDRMAKFRV